MESNLRNILIIFSAVIIAAIFIHGLWTIRKQKNPYKLKTSKNTLDPIERNFDGGGFDQDGVGQVKVTKHNDDIALDNSQETGFFNDESNVDKESVDEKRIEDTNNSNTTDNTQINTQQLSPTELILELDHAPELIFDETKIAPVADEPILNVVPQEKSVYKQPVTQAKPVRKSVKKPSSKIALKRNQMEINFGEGLVLDEELATDITNVAQVEQQIIILSVVMPANQQIFGAALLPCLLTLGMKYGEMNIFHRHQDNAGNGNITFSVANMMNPGSFDLDSMETFVTQGISLFMTLPNAGDSFVVFEQMLAAAKQLAQEFNAQLLDDKRNVMTKQTEQHYVSKIREFDRQHRLAKTL
ncbi:MAG: cell division protein ZipA [Colwellia sp.]